MLASTSVAAIEYDRTVDIVEAGADPTGSQPIDDVFHEVAQDGTLVEFPEGDYLVNHLSLYSLSNFGMRAVGDATLVPGVDYDRDTWIGGGETRNVLVEGFTIDSTDDGASPSVTISNHDGLIVRDILKRGAQNDGSTAFSFRVTEADGSGLVENVRAPDGDTSGKAVGMYVNTTGTLTVRDCRLEEFGNNGLYGSGSDGPIHVEGGFYRNNNVASVRLGSPGSYVKSADFVVDDPVADDGNYRAVRVSDGGGVTIEDVDVRLASGQGTGGIVCAYDGGSFDLRNSRIRVEPDYTIVGNDQTTGHAVYVNEATEADDLGERTVENVSISGGGTDYAAIDLNRDNNTVRNSEIQQDGTNRSGVHVASAASNNAVMDCAIEVTGQQVNNDGNVHVENLTDDASPADPSIDSDGEITVEVEDDSGPVAVETERSRPSQTQTETPTPVEVTPTETEPETETETPTQTETETATKTPTETQTETETPAQTASETETESASASEEAAYPVPSSDSTHATMGTTDDAPVVTVWAGLRCSYSAKFEASNFQRIVEELVRSGEIRVRQRTLPYDLDDPNFPGIEEAKEGVLAAEYALGVWEVDPGSYWTFYHCVFEKLRDGRWADEELLDECLRDAGVERRDAVRSRVESGRYHDVVERNAERAEELGVDFTPRLSFRDDTVPARGDADAVLAWIRDRL